MKRYTPVAYLGPEDEPGCDLEECADGICVLYLDAESSLAACREMKFERDTAITRAERAESCLRRVQRFADDGVDDPAGPHNVMAQIANTVAAVLSSPPADASKMGGECCDACPHDPDTCDRAECPAWGKSEEAKEQILAREANRTLKERL